MATELSSTAWHPCSQPDCAAAAAETEDGRCLAHTDPATVERVVSGGRRTRPLDARGVTIDAALLGRILAAAPVDGDGRRVLPPARFDEATFDGRADLRGAIVAPDTTFDRAVFAGGADFTGATFAGQARFGRSRFGAASSFEGVEFKSHAWFAAATFADDTTFQSARFGGPAWFGGARFAADATFEQARFGSDASFEDADFGCHAFFPAAIFGGAARFSSSLFAHPARWDGAQFRGPGGTPADAVRRATWAGAPLASWPQRAGAAVADLAVAVAIVGVGALLARVVRSSGYDKVGMVAFVAAVLAAAFFFIGNLVRQGHTGQTRGKRRFGLCLVRQRDGLPVGPGVSVVRSAAHVLDTIPAFVGWLWPLWDPRRQTFADKLLTTVVVRSRGWANPAMAAAEVPQEAATGFG